MMNEQELRDKLEMIYIKLLDIEEKYNRQKRELEIMKAKDDKKDSERRLLDIMERERMEYENRKQELNRFNKMPYLHVEGE